jgi:hypothetical protein
MIKVVGIPVLPAEGSLGQDGFVCNLIYGMLTANPQSE